MPYTKAIVAPLYGLLAKPYGTPDASSGSGVALGSSLSPFIAAYPWTDGIGFGTKYANPSPLPPGQVNDSVFNPDANVIFFASDVTPFVAAYAWSSSGFGTKYANMASLSNGASEGIDFNRTPGATDDHILVADQNAGVAVFINAWKFRTSTGWGTKFSNPASLPPATALNVAFSPNHNALAISFVASPFMNAYPWSVSGFGTKFANPAVLPISTGDVAFSKLGTTLAIAFVPAPQPISVHAYIFSTSGFGAKYADPLYPVGYTNSAAAIAFTNSAVVLGTSNSATSDQNIGWRWTESGGYGTRFPALPLNSNRCLSSSLKFNDSETTVFRALAATPDLIKMSARRWSSNVGFGTEYT
ncbi:MAG: hypothetical protein ACREUY_01415, partial [Burkholderiales bacterium]